MRGRRTLSGIAMGLALLGSLVGAEERPATGQVRPRPNILLILTDDQRADTLWAMPRTRRVVFDAGVRFPNAYVENPACCPSRATLLTGLRSGHTGVWTNSGSSGGYPVFDPSRTTTVAQWLDDAGYRTGLFGKYLNGYDGATVPPGWDRWQAFAHPPEYPANRWQGGGDYYDYVMSNQGTLESYGSTAAAYSTTVIRKAASAFIAEPSTQPFFAYVAVFGPHAPPKPAPVDVGVYATIDPYRPASFDEPDVSDKPAYVQQTSRLTDADIQKIDDHRRAHLETLRSVDRMIRTFTDQLAASGELEDTVIIFTSDNGLLWGEHRQTGKYLPYEESVHVPLAIRYDGATPPGARRAEMVWNGDIAPTIAALAGVTPPPGLDGRSLVPVIDGTTTGWPTSVPIAHGGDSNKPTYCGTRTLRYAYTIHATGEEELYDDATDPLQLTNVAYDPAYQTVKARLRTSTESTCDPPPPGFTFPAP